MRAMRLTPELVARASGPSGNHTADNLMVGRRPAAPADHEEMVHGILRGVAPEGSVWLFAYGSLIWNPCFEFVEKRAALARGWHRSFCLGWDHWFRGSVERPGLMLALDRGGSCRGMAYRLPPDALDENLLALAKREVHLVPHPFPPRWINLVSDEGPIRAITFAVDRASGAYVSGLSIEQIADALASAAGPSGSMADYLLSTVAKLEELGLNDRQLWKLQKLVADRLEAKGEAGV